MLHSCILACKSGAAKLQYQPATSMQTCKRRATKLQDQAEQAYLCCGHNNFFIAKSVVSDRAETVPRVR